MYMQNINHFSMSKNNFIVIILSIFVLSYSLTVFTNINNVFATIDNSNNNDNEDKKFQLNIVINLDNINKKILNCLNLSHL